MVDDIDDRSWGLTLARYLVDQAVLSTADVAKAQAHAEQAGVSLIGAIRRLSLADGRTIARAVAGFHRVPVLGDDEWPKSLQAANDLSRPYLRDQRLLPIGYIGDDLVVAIADPGNAAAIDAIKLATGRRIQLRVAPAEEIDSAFDRLTTGEMASSDPVIEVATDTAEEVEQLKDLALGAPVVRLVNQMLVDALHTRATDIHIEPTRTRLIVRQRIDGMLREMRSPPAELGRAIISRIKILSNLDIAERRLPQDGRARVRVEGRQLDLRVATVPTVNGESVAIRILENTQRSLDLAQLGFNAEEQALLTRHLVAPTA